MINDAMRLNVKMINSYTFPIDIHRKGSIGLLKQKIYEKISMVPSKQRLIYQGKVLVNEKLLSEYHLEDNDVVHLIEQTEPQPQSQYSNANESTADDTFNSLLSSLFARNPLMNLNSINDSNHDTNNDIPESFHHLLKQSNFIKTDSIEAITQGTNSLYDMINRSKHFILSEASSIKHLYYHTDSDNTQFKIGQWVDVQDSSDQWIEGQIASAKDNEVNVHYIGNGSGLNSQLNHWMDPYSNRISLFRSNTSQHLNAQFASPFPNKPDSTHSLSIEHISKFDPLTNDLITFFDLIKEKITRLMKQREALKDYSSNTSRSYTTYRTKDDLLNSERFYYLQLMQLYPLMDRLGRLLIDVSSYIMNTSFKFFEDNIYLFKSNIEDERLSFLNYNERNAEMIRKSEIKEFIKLTEYSVIKMKKIDAEVRRPVLGLLVNVHRNERSFNASRLEIRNEESFGLVLTKKGKTRDMGIQAIRDNEGCHHCLSIVVNEKFSIERITKSTSINSNNGTSSINSSNSNMKSNKRLSKPKKNEKVVLVSRDKSIPITSQAPSTLISQVNNPNKKSKKTYRLSQPKVNK